MDCNDVQSPDNEPTQEVSTKTQAFEADINKLSFKNVEAIVHRQCKDFIKKQEMQKTTSAMLARENNRLINYIKEEKKSIENLKHDERNLAIQMCRSDNENECLYQHLLNTKNNVEQFNDFVSNLFISSEKTRIKYEGEFKTLENNKKYFEDAKQAKIFSCKELERALNAEKNAGTSHDDLKNEKLLIEKEIVEKQAILENNNLKQKLIEMKENTNKNDFLQKEKLNAELVLSKNELVQIKNKMDESFKEENEEIYRINKDYDEEIKRTELLKIDLAKTYENFVHLKSEKQKKEETIKVRNQLFVDNKKKIEENITEAQNDIDKKIEDYENDIENVKNDVVASENQVLKEEIDDLLQSNDLLYATLTDKKVERDGLLAKKGLLQEQSNAEKISSASMQILNEQMAIKEEKIKTLTSRMIDLSCDPEITALTKTEKYLKASHNYLLEKKNNFQTEKNDLEGIIRRIADEIRQIKHKISTKKISNTDSLTGILKKSDTKVIAQPKKVQFANVQTDNIFDGDKDKLFDHLLSTFRKHQPAKKKIFNCD